jgi:hypothetical protein
MDPQLLRALEPVFILLTIGVVPISIVFSVLHFKHKRSELELERELRLAELANQKLALEARLRGLETAVQHLAAAQQLAVPQVGDPQARSALPALMQK